MFFPFWDRGAPRAFELRHRYKKSLKPRRFQADSSTSGVMTRAGPRARPELLLFRFFDLFIGLLFLHGFGRLLFFRLLAVHALAHDGSPVRIRRDDIRIIIARPGFRRIFFLGFLVVKAVATTPCA
jgi:hypothetical protein